MNVAFTMEHVFRSPSVAALLGAYFNPEHLAMLDAATGVGERTVRESIDDGTLRRCTWQLTTLQPLPWIVRRFVTGGRLKYLETARWRRGDRSVELTNICELLGGRVRIDGVYHLEEVGAELIRQRFAGTVSSDIKVVGSIIVRATADELASSMPRMNKCTQEWLDRQAAR